MNAKTHIDSGLRSILESPTIFNFFNNYVLGGKKYVKKYCNKYFNNLGSVKMLDIGCGTAEILKALNKEIEYYGFDMQEEYISYAKNTFKDRGKFFIERVSDDINSKWLSYFDIINIHGLIHHLSDDDCDILLSTSYKYLKDGGSVITVDSVFHDNQSLLSKFLVSKDRGRNIRTPKGYLNLASKDFKIEDSYVSTNHINIPYSVFTMHLKKNSSGC